MREELRGSLCLILLFAQLPGCTYLLSEPEWKKLGLYIKHDARPAVIMRMFEPVGFVYDFTDTEGTELPERLRSFKGYIEPTPQPVSGFWYPRLKRICKNLGILCEEKPLGALVGGCSRKPRIARTWNVSMSNTTRKTQDLLHEMGHILCGHLPFKPEEKGRISASALKSFLYKNKLLK